MLGTGSKTYSQKKLVMLNGDESDGKIRNKNHLKPTHPSEVPGGGKGGTGNDVGREKVLRMAYEIIPTWMSGWK